MAKTKTKSKAAYPCYVRVAESVDSEEVVELPTEENGTMQLSTIAAQYPDTIGLRFKSESGAWRGVRVTDGILDIPIEGWGNNDYYITVAKTAEKRKLDDGDDAGPKSKKEMLQDLIVLGLPYTSTEDDLKNHFEKYGELAHWEIKTERHTKKSKGFGFVRFTDVEAVEAVLAASHTLGDRKLDVRFPKRDPQGMSNFGPNDGVPTKMFIGRIPRGATTEDLRDCFSDYGPLKDIYIPKNFRGFGFVTFPSSQAANATLSTTHVVKGNTLNVTYPAPKAGEQNTQNMQMQQPQQYGYGNMQGGNMQMQGNMGNMPGNMQGNMQGNMHGGGMQGNMQQQGGWYGAQPTNTNTGYYTSGYFQSAGKIQNGKTA